LIFIDNLLIIIKYKFIHSNSHWVWMSSY